MSKENINPQKILPYAKSLFVGIIAAVISAVLIYYRLSFDNVQLIKNIVYYAIPLAAGLVIIVIYFRLDRAYIFLGTGLAGYLVVFSLLEPIAYKFWIKFQTPAGQFYTAYQHDGLYPFLGGLMIAIIFIILLTLFLLAKLFSLIIVRFMTKPEILKKV